MPSIADVKAAADSFVAQGVQADSPAGVLLRFIDGILKAPGLSAERLAEIDQRLSKARTDLNSDESPWDLQDEADELLAEVMRLRAGVGEESQPERVMPPAAGTDSIG